LVKKTITEKDNMKCTIRRALKLNRTEKILSINAPTFDIVKKSNSNEPRDIGGIEYGIIKITSKTP